MIITLLSDFGQQDSAPGIAKGILLKRLPKASLVDLSHDIAPHHLLQCCYFLKSSYTYFPENTIHLSLFDLFSRKSVSGALLAKVDGQFIISADNGLLPMTFGDGLQDVFPVIEPSGSFPEWVENIASFLQEWEQNDFSIQGLEATNAFEHPYPFEPYTTENSISCQIIHIDRFGNVVLNLTKAIFEAQRKGRKFSIAFSRNNVISQISQHYSDVPEGEKLCLFNMGGFMEIAVNKGSAAQLFGFSLMREQQLLYQKIKIDFL